MLTLLCAVMTMAEPLLRPQLFGLQVGERIGELRFSANQEYLIVSTCDGLLSLWDVPSKRKLKEIVIHRRLSPLAHRFALMPDARHVAVVCEYDADCSVRLLSVPEGAEVAQLRGHSRPIGRVAVSPDGKLLATASARPDGGPDEPGGHELFIWNLEMRTIVQKLKTYQESRAADLVFSPDGRYFAYTVLKTTDLPFPGSRVTVLDTKTWTPIKTIGPLGNVPYQLTFGPKSDALYIVHSEELLRWKTAPNGEGPVECLFSDARGGIHLQFSPDGALAVFGDLHKITFARARDMRVLYVLEESEEFAEQVTFTLSANGKRLAFSERDSLISWGTLKIADLEPVYKLLDE